MRITGSWNPARQTNLLGYDRPERIFQSPEPSCQAHGWQPFVASEVGQFLSALLSIWEAVPSFVPTRN